MRRKLGWVIVVVGIGGAMGLLATALVDARSRIGDLEREVQAAPLDSIGTDVAELQQRVDRLDDAASALAALIRNGTPDASQMQRDLDDVSRRLDDLEQSLFGWSGTPAFESDVIGTMQADVSEIHSCLDSISRLLRSNFGGSLLLC